MMQLDDFVVKKCNSGKNMHFAPKRRISIDLEKAMPLLEKENALIEVESPSLLIFRLGDLQIDLNANGKTIVKTEDIAEAKKAFLKALPGMSAGLK